MNEFNTIKKNVNKKAVPIFLSVEKDDCPSLDVALLSIKDNGSKKRVYAVYILHDGIEDSLQRTISRHADKKFEISFIDISGYQDADTAYRDVLTKLYPNLEKALYFKCNVVALVDVAELYNEAFESAPSVAHAPMLIDYNASKKPWYYTDVPYQDYFWKYAVQSAFYEEFLSRLRGFHETKNAI